MAQELGAAGYISYSSLTQQNLKLLMEECLKIAILGPGAAAMKDNHGGGKGCIVS